MVEKEFSVKGFVKNEGKRVPFTFQRSIPPGTKLTFAEAYKVMGEKSGKSGRAFIELLRTDFFAGPEWGFYKDEGVPFFSETAVSKQDPAPARPAPPTKAAKGAGKALRRAPDLAAPKGSAIAAVDIIDAAPDQARKLIAECSDKAVLKKAMTLSKHFAGKEGHMRHLMRRLEQVY